MENIIELTFNEHPGHGYLMANGDLIKEAGIKSEISGYSYYNPKTNTYYLEEDCDASVLLNKLKDMNQAYNITMKYVDQSHYEYYNRMQSAC